MALLKLVLLVSFFWALPVVTAWAQGAGIPRPEHPRPDSMRAEWLNLNGEWEFAETNEDEAPRFLGSEPYPDKIRVPFCRESELSGLGRKEFVKNVWYRRTFERPADWKSPRLRLHVGACDWRTEVWVNGEPAGHHTGGNVQFSFDITRLLKPGANTLIIHAFDDTTSGLQPLGKQSRRPESHGIFYTRTTGLWQTVWLEGVGATFIREFTVNPDPAGERLILNVALDGPAERMVLQAQAVSGGAEVATAQMPVQWRDNTLILPIPKPRLWSVQDPFLYDLSLSLLRGPELVDEVQSYFGMRRVSIEGAAILINGQPVFQRTVLDQGFYPDGVWTAPSDEALRRDIELSQACGFNGARLHQKVFEPRFLYWADKLGYLVWGEYPSFGADYANHAVNAPILDEWVEIVQRDRNHPAIIGWCPFNETEPLTGVLQAAAVRATRAIDPSRPIIESSGYAHIIPDPEVLDAHDYDQNPESFRARWMEYFAGRNGLQLPERYGISQGGMLPFFVSEYGGIGWNIEGKGWGYGNTPENLEAFYARFQGLADAQLDNPNLFGLCYTQLTNVEQEQNGLYLYDRTPKFDNARLKAILGREAAYEKTPPTRVEASAPGHWQVLVGSVHDGAQAGAWRYSTEKPGDEWASAGFDDAAWKTGPAPFGFKEGDWMGKIKTEWKTNDLWLRQEFTYDGGPFDAAALVLHHDDDTEIFLNGQPLWSHPRWNDRYESFDVTEALRAALKPGANVIAAHVHQDRGGQYLDLALLVGKR
jgi:hypothetical protein